MNIEALNEAIKLIRKVRVDIADGSQTIWNLLFHAEQHLDKQIAAELAAD
jgi:hypothetical protein